MTANFDSFALESAARTLLSWLGHALLYGTLLALMTAVVLRLFARRIGHAVHVALWLIVLVKFVMPVAPASPMSLATLTTALIAPLHNDAASAATGASEQAGPIPVYFVGDKPAPQPAIAASQAVPWWTIIAGGYLAVVAVIAAARILSYRRFLARCRRLPCVDDTTLALVAEACRRLGAHRVPDVRLSEDAPAPFVLGTLSPMLILSRRHLVRPDESEAVILHEVAHLRRGDLLVRYVQWIAGTLLFFWPVVAWVNRRIDLAREQACDEWALRHGRLSAGEYARCILRALHPATPGAWLYRPAAMATNLSTIERRIDMILNTNGARSRRALRWPIVTLLAAWAGFALSGAASAQDGTPASTGGKVVKVATQTTDADGTVETEVVSDDGKTFNIRLDGPDGAEHFIIELVGEAVELHGPGGHRVMVHAPGEPGALHEGVFVPASESALADFAENYPAADVDADGSVTIEERGAYLTALAMSAPDVVLTQYPFLDENENGLLEAEEAAHLFGGVGMFIVHMKADVEGNTDVAADADVEVDMELQDCDAAIVEDQNNVMIRRVHVTPPDGQEPPDVLTHVLPPHEWLLENVTADLSVDTVASYLEVVRAEHAEMQELHNGAWVPQAGPHHFFSPNAGQVRVKLRPVEEHTEE